MYKVKLFLLVIIFLFVQNVFSQKSDFDFLVQKIKTVYAGYKDKVSESQFEKIVKNARYANGVDTFIAMSNIVNYFQDQHLLLYQKDIKKFIDSNQAKKNFDYVTNYLQDNKRNKNAKEGYWLGQLNDYALAIIKDSINPKILNAYVIESRGRIVPGHLLMSMTDNHKKGFLTDYMDPSNDFRIISSSFFNSDTVIFTKCYGYWNKINQYHPQILNEKIEFNYYASLKIIDQNNVLLKMPDFSSANINIIDSLVRKNSKVLENTKNLILDIRENAGGTIRNYFPLIPYVYTNTIMSESGFTLCSEDLILDKKEILQRYLKKNDTNRVKNIEAQLENLIKHKGEFIFDKADTLAKDYVVKTNPKNIAILTNRNSLSAAELMVLHFNQSSKTKIFGEPTGGAIDYLNTLSIDLPSGKYFLTIASVKRKGIKKYDLFGIPPDVIISYNEKDWIGFVKKYYEKQ